MLAWCRTVLALALVMFAPCLTHCSIETFLGKPIGRFWMEGHHDDSYGGHSHRHHPDPGSPDGAHHETGVVVFTRSASSPSQELMIDFTVHFSMDVAVPSCISSDVGAVRSAVIDPIPPPIGRVSLCRSSHPDTAPPVIA